ncbi:hypothetical protein UPYG_G00155970 [Umbra pygmaea]|uniref:Uncharacterized protein n=1 Tax=Umbra pygmaea TaxID=75934 RepID=A0ABD0XN06_UMBPY
MYILILGNSSRLWGGSALKSVDPPQRPTRFAHAHEIWPAYRRRSVKQRTHPRRLADPLNESAFLNISNFPVGWREFVLGLVQGHVSLVKVTIAVEKQLWKFRTFRSVGGNSYLDYSTSAALFCGKW